MADQLKSVLELIYQVASHTLPPGLDEEATAQAIWEFARGNFTPQELAAITSQEDPLLELGVAMLWKLQEEKPIDLATTQELVARYLQAKRAQPQPAVPSGGASRQEFLRRLGLLLPQLKPPVVQTLADSLIDPTVASPQDSLPVAVKIVEKLGAADVAAITTSLAALAPVIGESNSQFAQTAASVAATAPEVAGYVTTAVFAGFSPETTLAPSPQFEAATATATQSPATAAQASSSLAGYQTQLKKIFTEARQVLAESAALGNKIDAQLRLNPDLPQAERSAAVAALKAAGPLVIPTTAIVDKKTPAEKRSAYDEFLLRLGLAYSHRLGYNLTASARSAMQKQSSSLLDLFREASPSVQAFYLGRASPRLAGFLDDLTALDAANFDLTALASVAVKWLPVGKWEAQLAAEKVPLGVKLEEARIDLGVKVVSKLAPPMAPVARLLGIAIKHVGHKVLLPIGKRLRRGMILNFLVGVVVGVPIGLFWGVPLGLVAGYLGFSLTRGALALRANAALATVGTAAIATFTSFMTVSAVVFLTVPIVVALMLFIINSSAHLVPPPGGFLSALADEGFVNRSSCPLISPRISTPSYSGATQTGHGSNAYWQGVTNPEKQDYCRYSLPQRSNCLAPTTGQDNICRLRVGASALCDFYGFALDVVSQVEDRTVSLPQINGQDVVWNFNGTYYQNLGAGSSYGYTDSSGKYSLLLTHLEPGGNRGQSLSSGTPIGQLLDWKYPSKSGKLLDNTHLHLEFQVDGRYVKPENYFCNF